MSIPTLTPQNCKSEVRRTEEVEVHIYREIAGREREKRRKKRRKKKSNALMPIESSPSSSTEAAAGGSWASSSSTELGTCSLTALSARATATTSRHAVLVLFHVSSAHPSAAVRAQAGRQRRKHSAPRKRTLV